MKKIVLISAIAFLLSLILIIVRYGWVSLGWLQGFPLAIITGSILFFGYTLISINQSVASIKPIYVALAIAIGSSILELSIIIINFKDVHTLFPIEVVLRYVSVFVAYLVYTYKSIIVRLSIVILNFSIIIWIALVGSRYIVNYKTFGSWTGKVAQVIEQPFSFQTPTGEMIDVDAYKGHYLILDCWSTTCGVCYKKFPDLQKLYDKYKDDPAIKINALHCRYEKDGETYETGFEILTKRGHTFPCLSIDMNDPAIVEAGVKLFPTVLIFSPDSKLIFRGNLEDVEKFITDSRY